MVGGRGSAGRVRTDGDAVGHRRAGGLASVALAAGAVLALAAAVVPGPRPAADGGERPRAVPEPAASGQAPADLCAVGERVPTSLPSGATLDRLALTPHHVVVVGRVPDLDGVADVVENLVRIPGIEEPDLRRAVRSERGVEFGVVLAAPSAAAPEPGGEDRDPPPPPAYAATPVTQSLDRLLFPAPT